MDPRGERARPDLRPRWAEVRAALVLLALAGLCGGAAALWHPRAPRWGDTLAPAGALSAVEVAARERSGRTVLWVDAREASAYAAGHVPGAVLLNETDWGTLLPGFLARWEPDRLVVVYCGVGDCAASRRVRERLQREIPGLEAWYLDGGWAGATP